MRRPLSALWILVAGIIGDPGNATAQNFAVQEPAFSNFQVQTTVSVPDRGGAFLGGVSRGARSSANGLLPAGSRVGAAGSASSLEVRVWIHDFEELDRLALQSADAGGPAGASPLKGPAELAWRQLSAEGSPSALARSKPPLPTRSLPVAAGTPRAGERIAGPSGTREAGVAPSGGTRVSSRFDARVNKRPMDNKSSPTEVRLPSGSVQNERATAQPLGFEAKSKSKRSGSAR